jgi:excisionase family DNA binding protein
MMKKENKHKNGVLDLLTLQEVSEIFRVSAPTIRNWVSKGILRKAKIGQRVYFRRSDLENLINKQILDKK